jgi:hypothetical protein
MGVEDIVYYQQQNWLQLFSLSTGEDILPVNPTTCQDKSADRIAF